MNESKLIEMHLCRIVIRKDSDRQYIYIQERDGKRGFPIVIGMAEAIEIHRVSCGPRSERPMTHQLAHSLVGALGGSITSCDIVALRNNTFYAELMIDRDGSEVAVDARPSDAIALALREGARIRVSEEVLDKVRADEQENGPDIE